MVIQRIQFWFHCLVSSALFKFVVVQETRLGKARVTVNPKQESVDYRNFGRLELQLALKAFLQVEVFPACQISSIVYKSQYHPAGPASRMCCWLKTAPCALQASCGVASRALRLNQKPWADDNNFDSLCALRRHVRAVTDTRPRCSATGYTVERKWQTPCAQRQHRRPAT